MKKTSNFKTVLTIYVILIFLIALTNNPLEIITNLLNGKFIQDIASSPDINFIYHYSAYFILGILAAVNFKNSPKKIIKRKFILLTLIFVLIISSTDELLQLFTPDRMPDFIDLIYDFFGALSSQLFFYKPKSD